MEYLRKQGTVDVIKATLDAGGRSISKDAIEDVLDVYFDIVLTNARQGNQTWGKIGKFTIVDVKARSGVANGVSWHKPDRKVLKFNVFDRNKEL